MSSLSNSRACYQKCPKGGENSLHQGEVMTLVCMQESCPEKGLICPVCYSQNHDKHKIMHVKLFITEIQKQINPKDSEKSLVSLSDYLRSIEQTKKLMLNSLKEIASALADKIKIIQSEIMESYLSIRKTVMSQSTLSSKLKDLTNMLLGNTDLDSEQINKRIANYVELVSYKNNEFRIADNSKKLIEQYELSADRLSLHLRTVLPEMEKKLSSLPIKFNKFSKPEVKTELLTFDSNFMANDIELDGNKITVKDDTIGGLAFVQKLDLNKKHKIAFKIESLDSVILGLGNGRIAKGTGFQMNYDEEVTSLFGICSIGVTLGTFQPQSVVFSSGDIIEVEWDPVQFMLSFSRRHGVQKFEMPLSIDPFELKDYSFFCGLTVPGQSVHIVQ